MQFIFTGFFRTEDGKSPLKTEYYKTLQFLTKTKENSAKEKLLLTMGDKIKITKTEDENNQPLTFLAVSKVSAGDKPQNYFFYNQVTKKVERHCYSSFSSINPISTLQDYERTDLEEILTKYIEKEGGKKIVKKSKLSHVPAFELKQSVQVVEEKKKTQMKK